MEIIKGPADKLNKYKKLATILSNGVIILSKPEKAKVFFLDIQKRIIQTRQSYKKLIKKVKLLKHLTHEVENLFDNYYIIDGAISDITEVELSKGFKKIVLLERGIGIFVPRIYFILSELLQISDYKISKDILYSFLQSYQARSYLSIRELSYVSFFLRIILIEQIESLMKRSTISLNEFKEAEYWFARIVKIGRENNSQKDYSKLTSEMAQKYGVIPSNLGFYLLQKLAQYGPDTRSIVKWLKLNLLKQGIDINNLAELKNKRQNENSNLISNIINSLRWINQVRWDDFVVDVNIVDSFLNKDPAGAYSFLDSASQNIYRSELVKISDQSGIHESEVAKLTLRLCQNYKKNESGHVGYYLIGQGREELELKSGYKKNWLEKSLVFILRNPFFIYLGLILLLNIILTIIFNLLFSVNFSQIYPALILLILIFILNWDISLNLINILVNHFIPVRPLLRLDLSTGVSVNQTTFVVVPSMFRDFKSADELLRRLEINFLSNAQNNIYYALLMDFKDAKTEILVTDQGMVDYVNQGIQSLNEKYPALINRFYLFHRRRLWNPHEKVFMGWERKRGKLREFNLLLRRRRSTSYIEILPIDFPHIQYVVTIDEDTRLSKDSVIKLIGSIDHPLNRPVLDLQSGQVVSGYGIIQPHMTSRFLSARATLFSRLFSSAVGIDSYSGPIADIYQDLFNNSIFFGKGIYDIDIMEATIGDKIPENQVLSHDLLEGLYTKVGFATDIFLFEGFPESYKEYILRMHRWIRGDWQIIKWFKKGFGNNSFTLSDKWKIFDNLRRSTLPIFIVLFLFISYFYFRNSYFFLLVYALFVSASSFIIAFLFDIFRFPREMTLLMKFNSFVNNLDTVLIQIFCRFIFLLDQAVISLRAIFISLYRSYITRRNMLCWQNSHEVSKGLRNTLREYIYLMCPSFLLSALLLIFLVKYHQSFYAYMTVLFWFIAPFVALKISKRDKILKYQESDLKFLRNLACRSSRFFLELSGVEGNNLIPDHYQEEPMTNSPSATSPTNIGMHLLSVFSAHDLGYISISNFQDRLLESFKNLNKLDRYRGHFYNWYDIHTLQVLNPKYVSSVDSANFLLSLITLKQGILDIIKKPILTFTSLSGIVDILAVLIEDTDLIIKDKKLSKIDKKLAKQICEEAKFALNNYLLNDVSSSTEYFKTVLNNLSITNEKIKKIVSKLNLGPDKGIISSIYSSTEHFNTILKQQIDDLNIYLSFNQMRHGRPVIRNVKNNELLIKSYQQIVSKLDLVPSLEFLANGFVKEFESEDFINIIHSSLLENREKESMERWYKQVLAKLLTSQNLALISLNNYKHIIVLIDKFFAEMDFAFLYNKERGLFHIGYNVSFDKIDNSYYDFLASESNSISLVSIIKGDAPIKHWSYLGRKLVRLNYKSVLLSSWGGSLFEYLTSLIFFRTHPDSLLGQTANFAIGGHIDYAKKYNIPWGMGESACASLDLSNNYQYQIFGHPALGFKRDLKDYLVIAPYTTVMALTFRPKEALINLKKLVKLKFLGRYGFYDAIDYTKILLDKNISQNGLPAKIYYAHHQGFSLQSLNNQINNNRISTLFMSDPRVEALDTLFEEKMPSTIPAKPIKNLERIRNEYLTTGANESEIKQFIPALTAYPRLMFISNGSYHIRISNVGAGFSQISDLNLTRFRPDGITESSGQFIYIYDLNKNNLWSPTIQPIGNLSGKNKIEFYENKVKFSRIIDEMESSLLVTVSTDSNAEFRSLTLTNHGKDKRDIKISSYGEISLAKVNDDLHHSSFQKLFIKAEYWPEYNALIYTRPNKDKRGEKLYFAHNISADFSFKSSLSFTTVREEFISRGGNIAEPEGAISFDKKNKTGLGSNLDPIFSFQNKVEIKPDETITINYTNIFANSKEEIIRILKKYSNYKNISSAIKKSGKQSQEVVNSLGLSSDQAIYYQALASRLLNSNYLKSSRGIFTSSEPAVQTLWRHGISGDLPIILLHFYDLNDLAIVKNTLLAHRYLKYKGIDHDLILLNEYPASYIKSLEDEVDFLIRYNHTTLNQAARGRVFHLRSSHLILSDKENILSFVSIQIDAKAGAMEKQILDMLEVVDKKSSPLLLSNKKTLFTGRDIYPNLSNLEFYNGLGGFSLEDKEYILNINYTKSLITPAPWVNIISNKNIGSVITESGSMYTWLFDSYDNRLTRRIDDSLLDRSSEVFYLRDEATGEFWCPTPLPLKNSHTYTIKHGLGYSKIEHKSHGLNHKMLVYVTSDENVKIINFKFTNVGKISKKFSLMSFFEISFGGANWEDTRNYLKIIRDEKNNSIIIRNIFNESFKEALAFVDVDNGNYIVTNDREEFLGKNNDLSKPSALKRERLTDTISENVDNCLATQSFFELAPGEEKEINILLGGGYSIDEIRNLINKYRSSNNCELALSTIKSSWFDFINKIQIKTPDQALNILFNERLLYQLISSRLLARTGYYQPSGAYGFRDQLQDSMALIWSKPEMTRNIILKAAKHQYLEGDAMNWWHDHNSFGVRSAFSDHQIWLPYVVSIYLEVTADHGILNEKESYMKGPLLDFINNPQWAGVPEISSEKFDLYDHCLRAIEKTFVFGPNGLPLIGNGDWNDGLNKVGERGNGESIWLGWFLFHVVDKFIPYIRERGDLEKIKLYEITLKNLQEALKNKAWDKKWYKRAIFDNGNALGSRHNKEFKIDSISQSWAVLSGAGSLSRQKQAMNSLSKYLFQDDLLVLIDPALDKSAIDPGYIRDYPAGVRENGAQYNHAALWAAQAFADLQDPISLIKILDSVNPIKRSLNKEKIELYRVEPYVLAGDIYAKPQMSGRGGWTWYTGSAGVMYRTVLEYLLGIKIRGNKMNINPCIPKDWPEFSLIYTYKNTKYHIRVLNLKNVINKKIRVDNELLSSETVLLIDDGQEHQVEVKI